MTALVRTMALVLLGMVLALPATSAEEKAAAPPAAPPAQAVASAPAAPQAYDVAGRRDPFRPFTLDIRPERRLQATPLQRYELGQLAVVATVWDVNPPRAMVEDSGGMGYIISLGTPIGRAGGIVAAIEPQRIVVEERVLDYYGKEHVNRIVMETPKEEGPNQAAREQQ